MNGVFTNADRDYSDEQFPVGAFKANEATPPMSTECITGRDEILRALSINHLRPLLFGYGHE